MEQLKDYIMLLYPKYEHELIVEPDPEQSFILGNRWADYGLCFAFALALPIVRAFLRSRIYQVSFAGQPLLFVEFLDQTLDRLSTARSLWESGLCSGGNKLRVQCS